MTRLTIYLAIIVTSFSCSLKDNSKPTTTDKATETTQNSDYEFYGNYIPTNDIWIKGLGLKGIEIDTHDSLNRRIIKGIFLRFRDTLKHEYYIVNTSFTGTKDNFQILANDSVLGQIEIAGNFLGERGPMNDNIKDPSTIVFKGLISAKGINKAKLECRYFEGD